MPEPDNGNQRVNLAVIQNELSHLRTEVASYRAEVCSWQHSQGKDVEELKEWKATAKERWESHAALHQTERGVLATLSAIFSAIGGAVGVFVNRP